MAAAVAAIGVLAPSAQASSSGSDNQSLASSSSRLSTARTSVPGVTNEVIARYNPYVRYAAGTGFVLNAPAAMTTADPGGYASALAAVEQTNSLLASTASGLRTSFAATTNTVVDSGPDYALSVFWWGWQLSMDEWLTLKVEALQTMGPMRARSLRWWGVVSRSPSRPLSWDGTKGRCSSATTAAA